MDQRADIAQTDNRNMTDQIVLTALDGALLNSLTDCSEAAIAPLKSAIAQLQTQGIPVIVFTERDRTEIEPIRQQLKLTSPFIVESGSGIFTPVDHNPFAPALGELEDGYYVEALGCPYVQARAGLRVIANLISHPLKGFGDFTVPQLQRVAGLSEEAAHQAKAREFSEPFMTPKAVSAQTLIEAAEETGFAVIVRTEERFSELLGRDAGLASAARAVITAYQAQLPDKTLKVMGISHRTEDLAVLASASQSAVYTEVLISSAPAGWLSAVQSLLGSCMS